MRCAVTFLILFGCAITFGLGGLTGGAAGLGLLFLGFFVLALATLIASDLESTSRLG